MIEIKSKVGKSYIVYDILKANKCLFVYSDRDGGIFKTLYGIEKLGSIRFKHDEIYTTLEKELSEVIYDLEEREYRYLVVYSNAGKVINDFIANILKLGENEINEKFFDVIFCRNE